MWEQIRSNQFRSVLLVVGMGMLLLSLGYFFGLYFFASGAVGIVLAVIVWVILNLVAYFQGDSILLSVAGARKISPEDHPRLYNVVEEMKIASGLEKVPDVYIIDDPALNAFAVGRDPKRAAVAITSGLLEKLNRDELQGVIGHEIGHIKNRDVLFMAICSVMLGTIVMLAWYFSRFFLWGGVAPRSRRSSSSGGSGAIQLIILAVGIILMILAPIMAQLIYFAVSRRKEYLADASSALYTRYPEGLASALEKLAASTQPVKSANQATAPMYIVNPLARRGLSAEDWTSTHPPISERIRILRSMAGGASFAEYERAYEQVHKGGRMLPVSAVAASAPIALRTAKPEELLPEPDKLERRRQTSDLLWRLNDYKIINCDCGTRLKVPPAFKESSVKCPHCGRVHPL
ncbi:MAG: M48 family metallopeptidase [Chloroflexi bacterium]|nr:M48 family metallopeptidase [Chloroflexota bacterium]